MYVNERRPLVVLAREAAASGGANGGEAAWCLDSCELSMSWLRQEWHGRRGRHVC